MPEHKLEPEAEALLINPVRESGQRARRDGSRMILIGAVVGVVSVFLSGALLVLWAETRKLDAQAASNDERIDALYTVAKQEQDAKKAKGEPLAAPPVDQVAEDPGIVDSPQQAPPQTGQPGPEGPRGPGPSAGEVAQAVASYCVSRDGCRGPRGASGPSVTPAQVATAVSTYCDSRGQCQGPTGTPGADGEDGEDSTVPGPAGADGDDGADASPDQIAAAVEGYCAGGNSPCVGPKGDPGVKGDPGADSTIPGPAGSTGPQGPAVESFTFTFLGQTYTCTDTEPVDLNYECT